MNRQIKQLLYTSLLTKIERKKNYNSLNQKDIAQQKMQFWTTVKFLLSAMAIFKENIFLLRVIKLYVRFKD